MNNRLVIIPTFNECENIVEIIDAVFALQPAFDVLVIDDNSPDGTGQLVHDKIKQNGSTENQLHLIERHQKSGLGTAYIEGFEFALAQNYQYIFEMDADFSHNPKDLIRLFASCHKDGNDVAIGSRYKTGVNVVNWPLNRVLLSVSASLYVQLITGMRVKDPTAGFVCYKKQVLEKINLPNIKFTGYAFQIEMKYIAWKAGFQLKEVPIVFTDRVKGKSKMSISIFWEAFWGVLGMKFSDFRDKIHADAEKAEVVPDLSPEQN